MPPIRLKIETHPDLDRVARPYRKFREKDLAGFLETLANILYRHIVGAAPVRTGTGRKAIRLRQRKVLEWEVVLDRRYRGGGYMTAQHEGVPPSKINPILPLHPKDALYWPGIRGGRPVAMVRNHPGLKALKFFDVGTVRAEGDIRAAEAVIESEIQRKFEE